MKYILVSGGMFCYPYGSRVSFANRVSLTPSRVGVISGVGKGIIASSTGLLLKTRGLKVTSIKIDPYMNVDAGTMSPTELVPFH